MDDGALRSLLDAILMLHAASDLETFPSAALRAVQTVVSGSHLSYNAIELHSGRVRVRAEPTDLVMPTGVGEILARHSDEHPLLRSFSRPGTWGPASMSDAISSRELHDLGLYADLYRPLRTEDQLVVAHTTAALAIGIAVNRDRVGFSDRERQRLDLLRPHLWQAYENAADRELMRRTAGVVGAHVVRLDGDGRLGDADAATFALIRTLTGAPAGANRRLAGTLGAWWRSSAQAFASSGAPPADLALSLAGRRVVARLIPAEPLGHWTLIVNELHVGFSREAAERAGLTEREAEVLDLAARGLGDRAIAGQLSISPHTVRRHLQNAFERLGVRTRASAIAAVRLAGP